jgi:hypothetical protein
LNKKKGSAKSKTPRLIRRIAAWLALPAFAIVMFWLDVPFKIMELIKHIEGPQIVLQPAGVGIMYAPDNKKLVIDVGLSVGNRGEQGDQITFRTAQLNHTFAPPIAQNQRYIPTDEGYFDGNDRQQALELPKDRLAFPEEIHLTWQLGVLSQTGFPQSGPYRLLLEFEDTKKKAHKLEVCYELTTGQVSLLQSGDFAKVALRPVTMTCAPAGGTK